jgi:hypothetical protein
MKLHDFFCYGFEWIDYYAFLFPPSRIVGERALESEAIARKRFDELGCDGDGDINLLWLPSFVFPLELCISTLGIVIWHVKQHNDGLSFLLLPIPLPFNEFSDAA